MSTELAVVTARPDDVEACGGSCGSSVFAGTEYKLKYAKSTLGYVWSVAKPLTMFAVLYTVFAASSS